MLRIAASVGVSIGQVDGCPRVVIPCCLQVIGRMVGKSRGRDHRILKVCSAARLVRAAVHVRVPLLCSGRECDGHFLAVAQSVGKNRYGTAVRDSHDGDAVIVNVVATLQPFDRMLYFKIRLRRQLLDIVWPGQFVEEGNLTVHVSNLRKVFGERKDEHRFIVTVPGHGYSFVADVNDEANGEIVVERHSLSRILIEEKIEGDTEVREDLEKAVFQRILPAPSPHLSAFAKAGIGIFAGILVLGSVAAWIYSLRGGPDPTGTTSERQLAAKVFTTAGGGIPSRVAISPDGKTLAYVESRDGLYSLRLGEIETNNSVQIAPYSDRSYRYLGFAPDGKHIYFTARDANHREPALMRVSVFGGAVQDFVPDVNSSVTFSPDGRSLAFLRRDQEGNRTSLIIADTETGKDERVLTVREKPENTVGMGVSWSPDGKTIAIAASDVNAGGTGILAVDVENGSISKIGAPVENRIVNLVWLADGSGLVFNRNTANNANDGHIWLMPYPLGAAQRITNDTLSYSFSSLSVSSDNKLAVMQARSDPQIRMAAGGDMQTSRNILEGARFRAEGMHGLAIAPDGKILFTAYANDSRTIWEMDANGGNQRQLTTSQKDINDTQINVTADNRFIVFDSNRSGSSEIWRANRDGSDLRQLTTGGENLQPTVSPDSSWVIYIALHDGRYELRRLSIEGGEPTRISTEKSFWPAISPDGRFIAFAYGRLDANPNRVINIIPFEGGPPVKTFDVPVSAALYNRLRWSPDGNAIIYKDEAQGLWRQDLSRDSPNG